MNEKEIQKIKEDYPKGTRVSLIKMDDTQAPPVGTKGTIIGVDDIGSILVRWDNGSSLNLIPEVDGFNKLDSVKTICYGKEELWDDRKDAINFFEEGIYASEGSERDRYCTIVSKLKAGYKECSDEA